MPGFARVGEAASFLNELGTDSACEFGADNANKIMVNETDIALCKRNLFHIFLAESTL